MVDALWPPICCSIAMSIAGYTAWRSYQWANKNKAEGTLLETALAELGQLRSSLAAGYYLTPTELDETLGGVPFRRDTPVTCPYRGFTTAHY